jgi:predicted nucleic acid-binding protein
MKVYLDTCSLQRPLDSRTQVRIALEAEAVLGILALVESGELELVSSDVLVFELRRNPRPERRAYASDVLSTANAFVQVDSLIQERAVQLEQKGIKPLDALHLAAAEAAEVDYFCTTDDKLLQRGKSVVGRGVQVVSPVELIEELS